MLCCHKEFCLSGSVTLFLFLSFQMSRAQVPIIACPEYFRYLSDGTSFFGRITLPNISEGNTKLEVHLSQSGTVPQRNPSNLSLYESEEETVDKFLNGKPITYRVDFPVPNALLKLTLISVNDAVICSDQDYPAPSFKMKLTHNLLMKVKTAITPFHVREKGSGAELANSLQNIEKASTISKPSFTGNIFLNNVPKSRPTSVSTTEANKVISNSKPIFKDNPFLSNFSNKLPTTTTTKTTTTANNFDLHSKSKYTGNPFLTSILKQQGPGSVESTPKLNEVCGRESLAMTPFIRGGTGLNRGEFPWLVAIYRKVGADLKFICAGSLISARTVISAAHCFVEHKLQADRTLVLLGRNNLEVVEEPGSVHQQLESLLLHPEYNANAISDADIALLQLKTPVNFTRYITPICLWNSAIEVNDIAGHKAYVAGWGADQKGELVTEQPKKIETLIANDTECKRSLGDYQTVISSRTICVSTQNDVGPCTGDSGGGLAMYTEGHWTLRGIVSAGLTRHGKCFSHEYYYFCDVAKHMNWIQRNMLT